MTETANLHAEVEALREQLDYQQQELQEQSHKQHHQWIAENLEEAQRIIDNIVGIKGVTEDPLKVAAELEALTILTSHTDTTNTSVIAANTNGTLGRQFVQPPHEELYGY